MARSTADTNANRPLRWFGRFCIFIALLALLVFLLPTIIARSTMRDRLINAILAAPELTATTEEASLGWFSPLSIKRANIVGQQQRFEVDVESIDAEYSWAQLLASSPDLGTILIDQPRLRLTAPIGGLGALSSDRSSRDRSPNGEGVESSPTGQAGGRLADLSPTFTAIISDASLIVEHDQSDVAIIDVEGMDLTVNVQESQPGLALSIEPTTVFTHERITRKHASSLLHLFNPSLQDSTQVEGDFSLSLDKLKLPLGLSNEQLKKQFELEGKLDLHQVSVDTNSPLLQSLAKIVADVHKKEPPAKTRVIKDSSIQFQVHDGRLFHEGLRFGFPDIDPQLEINSRGSVGLDQTLDVELEIPRLDPAKQQERGSIKCHVTGTVADPKLAVKDASLVIRMPGSESPLFDVDGVDMTLHIEDAVDCRFIMIDPVAVLDREQLNRRLAASLLHMIEPELQYSPQLEGQVSLSIDTLRIPVGVPAENWLSMLEIKGSLVIHQASSLANTPLRQAIVKLLSDLYGKSPGDVVRVVHDCKINFEIVGGRFHYEDLRIGFPDIEPGLEVHSSGSIGIDESLDVHLEVPRLDREKQREHGPVVCHVTGTVNHPKFSAKDASLVVRLPGREHALIDVDGVDLTMRLEPTTDGQVLEFEPTKILDHKKINRRLATSLLQLVEPELKFSPQLEGEVSLSFDTLRVPVGMPDEQWLATVEMNGKLVIHQVMSLSQTPIRQTLVKLLCDLNGKAPIDKLRIAHDSEVDFELKNGRFHFKGLQFGIPDIDDTLTIDSYGSIGLDDSLDIHVALPRLDDAKQRERGPVKCHLTGTVSNPKLDVKDASLVVRLDGYSEPVLDVDSIDLKMQIEFVEEKPVLMVDAVEVFDHQTVSAELSKELLRLVAPTLGDVADVEGKISLSLDATTVPLLGSSEKIFQNGVLSGKLRLHEISTKVKTPLLSAMVKVLADQFGKQPSSKIRIANNEDVRFELRNGRLFHDRLEFGLPDISPTLVCRSSGSVGLDGSLNLQLDVPAVLTGGLDDVSGKKIRFQISGSIDKPNVVEVK